MSIQRAIETTWQPQPLLIYKPRGNGQGAALRLQLRLDPEWGEKGEMVRKGTHGLFMEIAQQEGKGEEGFAKFGWQSPTLMRVKLGMNDVSKILTAIREVRILGKDVPSIYQPTGNTPKPNTLACFHKFGGGSTAINFTFDQTKTYVRVSKSASQAGSVSLDLHEELALQMYLEEAIRCFFRFGIR